MASYRDFGDPRKAGNSGNTGWAAPWTKEIRRRSRTAPRLKARLDYLRSVFTALSSEQRPVVTGFLGHSLIPAQVQQTFPEAVVLRLWREPVSNALSILKSRHASGNAWFSLFPRECEQQLNASEHEQVAAQVYWLNRRLDDASGGTQVIWMNYEALCANPTREMNRLADACRPMGLKLAVRTRLPEHFPCRQVDVEQDADAAKLTRRAFGRWSGNTASCRACPALFGQDSLGAIRAHQLPWTEQVAAGRNAWWPCELKPAVRRPVCVPDHATTESFSPVDFGV